MTINKAEQLVIPKVSIFGALTGSVTGPLTTKIVVSADPYESALESSFSEYFVCIR